MGESHPGKWSGRCLSKGEQRGGEQRGRELGAPGEMKHREMCFCDTEKEAGAQLQRVERGTGTSGARLENLDSPTGQQRAIGR